MCCILLSFSIGTLIGYTKAGRSKIQSIPFLGEIRPKRSFWPPECLSLSKRLLKKGGLVLFGKRGSPHLLPWIDQIFVGVQSPSFNKTNTPMKVLFLGKQKGLLYYLVQYRNWLFFCWLPAKSRGNINGVLGIPRLPPPLEAHLYLDWHQYTSIPFLKGEWPQEEPQEHIFCIVVACLSHDL